MAIDKLNENLNIISALDDEPNDVGGLTSEQVKGEFDKSGNIIKDYINDTLIPNLDGENLPLQYGVEGGQSIKEAMDGIVLGEIPDGSLSEIKLDEDLQRRIGGEGSYFANPYKNRVEITTSQEWTVPDGVEKIGLFLVGGGGGASTSYGQSMSNHTQASGGGGYCKFFRELTVEPGQELTLVIGDGGTTATGGSGGAGGNTLIQEMPDAIAYGAGNFSGFTWSNYHGGSGGMSLNAPTLSNPHLGGKNGNPGSFTGTGTNYGFGQGQGNTTDPFSGIAYAKAGDLWVDSRLGTPPDDVLPVDNTGNGGSVRNNGTTHTAYPGSSGIIVIYY